MPPAETPASGPGEQRKRKKLLGWVGLTAAVVVLLVVVGVVMSHRSSPSPTSTASQSGTSNTVNALHVVAVQYQQYRAEFIAALKQPGAEINQANADIQEQNNRISGDQTTQQNNEFGGGCNAGDYNNYSSCLSQEEQAAANASSDETAARAAAKNDENQLGAAYQQSEGAISTFVAQVDSIPWPTSLTRRDASQLEQSWTNYRGELGQASDDILNGEDGEGQATAQDNQTMTSLLSDIQTEFINLATALGIPPPSAAAGTT
jgi:hypothetical protein